MRRKRRRRVDLGRPLVAISSSTLSPGFCPKPCSSEDAHRQTASISSLSPYWVLLAQCCLVVGSSFILTCRLLQVDAFRSIIPPSNTEYWPRRLRIAIVSRELANPTLREAEERAVPLFFSREMMWSGPWRVIARGGAHFSRPLLAPREPKNRFQHPHEPAAPRKRLRDVKPGSPQGHFGSKELDVRLFQVGITEPSSCGEDIDAPPSGHDDGESNHLSRLFDLGPG